MMPGSPFRVIQSIHLVDGPFEDWSKVRSPGRAARRRRQGHPQRIRIYYTPSKQILQMGDTFVCHPEMYREVMKAFTRKETPNV